MKKITVLALAAFVSAFGAYKSFNELAKALEDFEFESDEQTDQE